MCSLTTLFVFSHSYSPVVYTQNIFPTWADGAGSSALRKTLAWKGGRGVSSLPANPGRDQGYVGSDLSLRGSQGDILLTAGKLCPGQACDLKVERGLCSEFIPAEGAQKPPARDLCCWLPSQHWASPEHQSDSGRELEFYVAKVRGLDRFLVLWKCLKYFSPHLLPPTD